VQGSIAYFETYAIDEAKGTISLCYDQRGQLLGNADLTTRSSRRITRHFHYRGPIATTATLSRPELHKLFGSRPLETVRGLG